MKMKFLFCTSIIEILLPSMSSNSNTYFYATDGGNSFRLEVLLKNKNSVLTILTLDAGIIIIVKHSKRTELSYSRIDKIKMNKNVK